MATFRPFEIVIVPFPFTDRRTGKRRPALALSSENFSSASGHTLLAMVTSAKNPPWPLDVAITSAECGLRALSKVRMKLFTLDNRLILGKVGSLGVRDRQAVQAALGRLLTI